MKVEFKGGLQLEAALKALGDPKAARRTGARALKLAAAPIVASAEERAPHLSGVLEISIGQQPQRRKRQGNGDVVGVIIGIDGSKKPTVEHPREGNGKRKGPVKDLGVYAYAAFQELGTEKMAANPFLGPAWEAEKDATIQRIGTELWSEISKTAARQARQRAKAGAK